MVKNYNIENNIKSIQNVLVNESIKERSNLQMLKSEEAIRNVLKSYSEKMNNVGDKLTNISKHLVNTKDIIKTEKFNDLFSSIYIDIKTLYTQIQYIDEILSLNLHRNKKFFSILKKRMRELWNKLILTRLNVTDSSQFDESYFEAFSNINSRHEYAGVLIDKKSGTMLLTPRETQTQNKRFLIKNISSTVYPVHNKDGGVMHTTGYLNTFDSSYRRDGQRDMLENGLWKEQVLTHDIPDMKLDIADNDSNPIWKTFNGIVAIVDIEFTQPIQFNNIDIDLFGDYPITLTSILYKNNSDGDWVPIIKLESIQVSNDYQTVDNSKGETAFDILSIKNIERTNARYMRLVFNQNNYEVLDSSEFSIKNLEEKIYNDFSERRYEVVKLDGGADDRPAIPKSYDNDSLYSQVTDIIEDTRSLEETITKIINLLEPSPKLQSIDFKKTLKYELGAWSIEPTYKSYSGLGKFNSGSYPITDRSLISVSITTKQEDIKYNTCNWFISNKNYNRYIPIIENRNSIRKEPCNLINPEYFKAEYPAGSFIQLDLPSSIESFEDNTKLWRNGTEKPISQFTWTRLSSTLIHVEDILDIFKNDYVIQYTPAVYDSVYVFTLEKIGAYDSKDVIEYEVVASRKSVLRYFLNALGKSNDYIIKTCRATRYESKSWFSSDEKTLCITSKINTQFFNIIPETIKSTINIVIGTRAAKSKLIDKDINNNTDIPSMIPIIIERDMN